MRTSLAVAPLVASLVAASSAPAGSAVSGIRGVLRLSHGCPGPVREGDGRRCDFAGAGVVIRVLRPGGIAALRSTQTDTAGRFSIVLPAGRYVLRADVPAAKPQFTAVSVHTASWTTVTLWYLIPPYMV
jgi:hypothetical protein